MTLEELTAAVRGFAVERDWEQFHTPKNLAMAVAGEAGELVAELQWSACDEPLSSARRKGVAGEMADVLIYLCRMADVLDVDLLTAAAEKLADDARRYPVAEVKGSASKRT
jgi:NTP pyrophosphatase (non-canonical NTP hydrolase)